MNKLFQFGGLLAALLLSASVYAGDIQIEGAWLRATAPGQEEASLDFSITSKQPAVLLGVSSTVSSSVEMHSMTHDKGMMKMRQIESIEIPAGKRVNLGESGYHLMLAGLKVPLKAGESIPLTLTIQESGNRTVKIEARAEVKPLTTTKASTHKDDHKHHH